MPCYSRVETKLKDVEAMKAAATAAGMTLDVNSKTLLTLVHGSTRLQFQRINEQVPFVCYAELERHRTMLGAITTRYAEAKVKAFAKKRGYMVNKGAKSGEFVLTSFR